jgi:hypothetical protein
MMEEELENILIQYGEANDGEIFYIQEVYPNDERKQETSRTNPVLDE